jgi:penicillin-binding protein 1A
MPRHRATALDCQIRGNMVVAAQHYEASRRFCRLAAERWVLQDIDPKPGQSPMIPAERRRLVNWLGVDAWLDSHVSGLWEGFKDRYNAASSFFARFRLTGVSRGVTELASEGLTLMAVGLVAIYVMAIPALIEFDEAKINATKYSVKFLDRYGNEIGTRGILQSDAVPLDEIPDHLIKATLATEDRRFFEHFGVDFFGTFRALVTNVNAGETVQGGSTLTQQLAKNLFLSPERSFTRKLKEVYIAFLLESRFTKREILKLYLDRAYMGGGAFGVTAAAQFYFGKSVRDVTLAEAAMMAGLFKAPTKYAPHANPTNARERAKVVLSNLVEAGFMTPGQVEGPRNNPANVIERRVAASPDWFLDWAFEEVQRLADGKNAYILTARTTVDIGLQRSGDEALQSTIRQYGRSHRVNSGAIISMEPDGAVRTLVGGVDYGESQFNRATNARRQAGSSFKLYVYAAALEHGLTPRTSVSDSSPAPCGPKGWTPKNYTGGSGSGRSLPLIDAFKTSLNTVATDLSLYKLGANSRDKVIEMTQRLGVNGVKKTCSMALGDAGVSPLEHTGAYAAFANNGKRSIPYGILELVSSKGDVVYSRERDEAPAPQVLKPRVVADMNQMMAAVVTEGTGKKASLEMTQAIGKTGTSSSYRDAWFMGMTGQYVTGVWLGNDDFRPMTISASAGETAHGVTGGGLPAQTWQAYMTVAHTSANVPTLPGLTPHPRFVQEQQRLSELRRTEPALAAAQSQSNSRKGSLMPDATRESLKRLADTLRKVAGLPPPPPTPSPAPGLPAAAPGSPPQGPRASLSFEPSAQLAGSERNTAQPDIRRP